MPITSNDWSVVVVGHWNRAILTPAGIVRRLLRLPEDTPVHVEVALDAHLPYRVRHDSVIITPFSDRLHVQPTAHAFEPFAEAMQAAWRALDSLPETPVVAAGFNLNYKAVGPYPSLRDATAHVLDDRLIDNDFRIDTRSIARALPWRNGHIKLSVTEDTDGSFSILLNFDRHSTSVADLQEWLAIPIADIRMAAERILFDCLDLNAGELRNGR